MKVFDRETKKNEKNYKTVDENDNDSVEGIMFSKNEAVIMTGTFVDHYESDKLNRIGLWYKPWFYKVRKPKSLLCRTDLTFLFSSDSMWRGS